jgi:hypothetical protein
MNKIKYAEKARDSILDIVVKNFDYFRDNPKHLAWAMMKWSLVHYASRIAYSACEDNPKYSVLDAGELLKSEEDSNLLYDAWGVSVSNDIEFPDSAREPNSEKLTKPNKTLDEWIDIKTSPQYKYSSLYPDERSVIDTLLCVIGTGLGWNKDGFITETGPSDVDENIFAGYSLAEPEIRKDIRAAINKFLNSKTLKGPCDDYMRKVEINWGDNKVEKTILNNSWKVMQDLEDRPELISQAEEAYRFVAYLSVLVETASKWNDKQWAEARKNSIWEYKGYKFDVSQVQPDFIYSTYTLEHEVRMLAKKDIVDGDLRIGKRYFSPRGIAWSNFVYKTNDHPESNKARAILMKRIGKNKPSKKEIDRATKLLRKHQPNYNKYGDIYAKAHDGDKEAADILDKAVGIPNPGWDTIKFIVEHEQRERKPLEELREKQKTYYPICEYSNMIRMPDNAHQSYVSAAIKVAQEIVDNKDERPSSRKYARKFLKKMETKSIDKKRVG